MTEAAHLHTTRTAYDTVATDYADLLKDALADAPLERAVLGTFAEYVLADGAGPVADVGCGPGRITTYLDSLGLDVFGIDLSPGMVAVARETYPGLRFEEGSMSDLAVADGALGGLVAWYSIIHTPPEQLPTVFAEFARVLAPGGHLLLAFQIGENETRHLTQGYGHDIDLNAFRLSPDWITALAAQVGIVVDARVVQEPSLEYQKQQQAYLLAHKSAD